MDAYTQGWQDAELAIKHKLPGHKDFSQGTTDWDMGWNAKLTEYWDKRIDEYAEIQEMKEKERER